VDYFVYAVAALLVVSVVLFAKVAIINRRPQKTGLLFALLAVPVFMAYYQDRWPFGHLEMRQGIKFLENYVGADTAFKSDPAPAFLIAGVLLVHMTVIQRVAFRKRLERLADRIGNFFSSCVLATLIGGVLVTTFHWGWVGSVIVGFVYALVYLGVLALLAAVFEIVVELARYILVWLKRQAFRVATAITRVASWVSSLAGRLGLTSLADNIRRAREGQEMTFVDEQESQDKELYEQFLRERARQRRLSGKSLLDSQEVTLPPVVATMVPEEPEAPTTTTTAIA
jgi:hypothetical protein